MENIDNIGFREKRQLEKSAQRAKDSALIEQGANVADLQNINSAIQASNFSNPTIKRAGKVICI